MPQPVGYVYVSIIEDLILVLNLTLTIIFKHGILKTQFHDIHKNKY